MAWGGLVLDTAAVNLWSDINHINYGNDDIHDDNDGINKGSSINYVITFGGLGRPPPPYVIL